ncbi:MAG: DUF1080 domain-containing protein [Verrucomicrobia bacterium]|jgi:hypothetical protein|nr:DUF1080 domain-containing protein [Verrucomicrobiota bacterium]MBT4276176.1 DUF1080 domain-containing protein [Verrucomicrobiota bacterium]MBT5063870.1 DUF1080 domain-containing protein [Verrucomicrobiota bacterium]MBT5478666.1 DUF1080 domain-containing protein [Verrucomicrobiota bacterium]MBT6237903.1 DUF1080 domain-containing protein [Verrucomicrobiota bacterium]
MKQFMRSILATALCAGLIWQASAADNEGFTSLFNGKNLDGWDGNPKFWSVRDGAITGQTTKENPTKGNTFIIWRNGKVDDFELRLQYKIINGNSGIQYRSKELGNWVVGGYQGDFEAGKTYSGILYEERGRGILAQRGQMTSVVRNGDKHKVEVLGSLGASEDIQSQIKNEDWNDYKIIAVENRFVHVINGRVTAIVLDEDKEKQVGSGILALQLHAGPPMTVQFRDIKIKKLKPIQIGGVWNMEIFSDQGVGTPVFHLQQQGNQLQGQYEGLLGKSPVKGTVSGDVVEFNISGEYEGQTVTASYRGKMKPNGALAGEVTLNDEMLLNWSATRKN